MKDKYRIPRGTYDILPQDSFKWQYLEKVFREVATNFNYYQITTPIFERAILFERSVGDTTDIVEKEMYKFKDKKDRIFALRPEGTASVVRSYVENNLGDFAYPVKLFYFGPMFRYDRPQKGRYRQFYQFGVENIGSNDPFSDAEVIALAYLFFQKLGLKNFQLEINSIGCSNCTKDYDNALIDYFKPFQNDLCQDCRIRIKKNPKRLLDCKVPSCQKIARNAPSMLDYLDDGCKQDFEEVKSYLKLMKIPYRINSRIVRGLDYYNKTAFEFINNNLGAQNALAGGGRYNGLVEQLGGKNVPGIGFAGGFERLILSMDQENLPFGDRENLDVYLVAIGKKAREMCVVMLQDLRRADFSADLGVENSSVKSQMKKADRSGAMFTLILGEDEIVKSSVILKNMLSGEQLTVPFSELIPTLKSKLISQS